MNSINFLKDKAVAIQRKSKVIFWLNLSSFIFLGLYILVLVVSFSYQLILKKQADDLERKFQAAKQEVESLSGIETKQVYLKNKLTSLQDILASQKENQQITEAVFNLIPEGIAINGFIIDEKGGVSFSASSKSFRAVKDFLDGMESTSQIGDLVFSQIKIKNINYDAEKGYSLGIYLSFKG